MVERWIVGTAGSPRFIIWVAFLTANLASAVISFNNCVSRYRRIVVNSVFAATSAISGFTYALSYAFSLPVSFAPFGFSIFARTFMRTSDPCLAVEAIENLSAYIALSFDRMNGIKPILFYLARLFSLLRKYFLLFAPFAPCAMILRLA